MRLYRSTIIIGFLFSCGLMAADITATITNYPKEVLQGLPIPVKVEIKNISGVPLAIACGGEGFYINFVTRHSSGKPRENCSYSPVSPTAYRLDAMVLKPGLYQEYTIDAQCDDTPGTVTAQLIVHSGICPDYDESKVTYGFGQTLHKHEPVPHEKPWGGEVKSEEVKIIISPPTGVDLQAYEEFHPKPFVGGYWRELVKKYPTSIYAGYQFKYLLWYLHPDLDTLTSTDYLKTFPMITDPFGGDSHGNPMIPSRQAVKARIKLLGDFLRAHPDFPLRADYLEGWLAEAYLLDGRYQDAYESYDWQVKHAKDKFAAETANKMKAAMLKKGLVRAPGS